ncbi:cobalamin biosynthesis protein [Krasilnikovia sp. MM14-A1259]|uniref:cobalamin biosynthesis protein n=1 Tax=Krasilnikovia sp. MM14-A1259 TaxID=3373539 RepID=UPI00382BE3EE
MTAPRAVVGVGARSGVPEEELDRAVVAALAAAGLRSADVGLLATLDRRAEVVTVVAARRGWAVRVFPAAELAAVRVPHPSARVAAATATPSVAEAAALLAAGPGAELVLPKTAGARVTVAVAVAPGVG